MSIGVKCYDPATGELTFDSATDLVAGGVRKYNTGKSSGSRTNTPQSGASGGWIVPRQLTSLLPSSGARPYPLFSINGHTISWGYDISGQATNLPSDYYWVEW